MIHMSYTQYRNNRKAEHDKVCPPREISLVVLKTKTERCNPNLQKVALCFGCWRMNSDCTCRGRLKPHYPMRISQLTRKHKEKGDITMNKEESSSPVGSQGAQSLDTYNYTFSVDKCIVNVDTDAECGKSPSAGWQFIKYCMRGL